MMNMFTTSRSKAKLVLSTLIIVFLGSIAYSYAQQSVDQDTLVENNLDQYQGIMDTLAASAENATPFPRATRERVNVMMENYLDHNAVVIREAMELGRLRNDQACLSMLNNTAQPALEQARTSFSEARAIPSTEDANEQHGLLASYLMVSAASFSHLHSVNSAYITCSGTN